MFNNKNKTSFKKQTKIEKEHIENNTAVRNMMG